MVTQIRGRQAKECIVVNGIPYRLKKDATDPTGYFPYTKMSWINAGCDKIAEGAYCCWISAVVPPTMGSLEKPVSVFALGFNSVPITMSPSMLSQEDMERMHFYTADYGDMARSFVEQFLDMQQNVTSNNKNRQPMSPFPPNLPLNNDNASVNNAIADITVAKMDGQSTVNNNNDLQSNRTIKI